MRTLSKSSSMAIYMDEIVYTEAALAADPETADLAEPFGLALTEWDGQFLKQRQSRQEVIRAEAVVAVRNTQLDTLTTRFGGLALAEVNQDRKAPLFKRLFPASPSSFIRYSLRKQCEHTVNVMVAEIKKLPETSLLKPFATLLADGATSALAALDSRTKVKADRGGASGEIDEWKESINRLRLDIYSSLLKRASERGYKRSWADTYFYKPAKAATEAEILFELEPEEAAEAEAEA